MTEQDFMNPPDTSGYTAKIEQKGLFEWVTCPFCGKHQFPITTGAIIKGQHFICKNSKCKKTYLVDNTD